MGTVELDADDVEGIETWLADVDKEKRPDWLQGYIVRPAMRWVEGEGGTKLYRRFSCIGFVLECYRSVGINLLDDADSAKLPAVGLDAIAAVYGSNLARQSRIREHIGIPGDGPWPIALPGYVFHSLARSSEAIREQPHAPVSLDERHYP